jgi:uncharacterized protein
MTDPNPAIAAAVHAIPPLWPLATSVAVNPFLGQSGEGLSTAAARLGRAAGARATMPRAWYRERIVDGRIRDEDLAAALAASQDPRRPRDLAALKQAAAGEGTTPRALPTIAELAEAATGIDWPGLVASRIGAWASGHFDRGQALWAAPRHGGPYRRWRTFASHDLTPEIAGLKGFCTHVATAPAEAHEAIARAATTLGLGSGEQEAYFHRLLMDLGGWAQYGRYLQWQAELDGRTDTTASELLALRLVWEEALLQRCGERVAATWQDARAAYGQPLDPAADLVADAILQEAAERAGQRVLAASLAAPLEKAATETPSLQAVFCIDVRSEVFRRALEAADPGIATMGFAGFFGLPVSHRDFASDTEELRLPVLLKPALRTRASGTEDADRSVRLTARASRAWGRFKLAAVSSFAFVEASGPIYVARLLRDALGLGDAAEAGSPAPQMARDLDPMIKIALAERVLRAMSLTQGFARLVLLVGHGAGVANNPQASALHCGACGGHKGEVNARLLAGLLNDTATRKGLARRGIAIPDDTLFVAALHDTTADAVTLFDGDCPGEGHRDDLSNARRWLDQAGRAARAERLLRLPAGGSAEGLLRRGRDWSQVRPEWALAGCNAFLAAPRSRTQGRDLQGRAFLHDYDWTADRDFSVLELIMTAPVVVASWISLQYYGSVVAPDVFGSGNKLLHNVTGGLGVVEGNGGLLRSGLALQSVSDGEALAHDPLRLSVCIEAPREAMSAVLERHPGVRALFDNRWLHLFALGPDGQMAWRYNGDLTWLPAEGAVRPDGSELALAS